MVNQQPKKGARKRNPFAKSSVSLKSISSPAMSLLNPSGRSLKNSFTRGVILQGLLII
jgi:hypothetical protein